MPKQFYNLKIKLFLFFLSHSIYSETILLENLEYDNPVLKELREFVKINLKNSKSSSELPTKLKFYKYKVSKGDNFFRIMARTGMNIDTLSSANHLSSPQDIRVGMILMIPNMRGVYDIDELEKSEKNKKILSEKYDVYEKNMIFDEERKEYFFAGKTLTKLEKSFFYGLVFHPPLQKGSLTSGYGTRTDPFTKKKTFHGGLDIASSKGSPVYASADGEVIFSDKKGGYGKLIIIKHIMGFETRYGHLDEFKVKEGELVKRGDLIGKVGSTGRATGPHLHFEVIRNKKNEKPIFYKHY